MLADVMGFADDCCNTALFKFVTLTKLWMFHWYLYAVLLRSLVALQ